MIAHAGLLDGWHDVPAAWTFEPAVLLTVCIVAAADIALRGDQRRVKSDYLALFGVAVALISPLDSLADALMSAHMVQHIILIFVIAPALAASRPWRIWRMALPRNHRIQVTRVVRRVPAELRHGTASAILATAATTAALWFWHLPTPYRWAHDSERWHAVDHLSLLSTAVWFWAVVHNQRVARRHGVALAMLACASMSGTALGALLVFGRAGTYPPPNAALGLSAASDQQLAGLLMSMVPMVGLLLVMARVVLDALAPHPATTAVPAPMAQRGDQLDLST